MNRIKKTIAGGLTVLILSAASVTAFAASPYKTTAEAAAGVTGKTVEDVTAQWQSGKGYGAIAAEAGKLEEFHQAVQEMQKDTLDAQVAAGTLTQAQADAWLQAIEQRQAVCDGTGTACIGNGCITGVGQGRGMGCGNGRGMGAGMRNGSCIYR